MSFVINSQDVHLYCKLFSFTFILIKKYSILPWPKSVITKAVCFGPQGLTPTSKVSMSVKISGCIRC